MKFRRIISMFLAVLFMLSVCTVAVGATDTGTSTGTSTEEVKDTVTYTYYTSSSSDPSKATVKYFKASSLEWAAADVTVFESPEAKLAEMDLRLQLNGYQIYVDEYSGEVACKNMTTEDILFTNPYSIGSATKVSESVAYELMSQIVIQYTDKSTGTMTTFTSFEQASLRGQIKVKNIKNGIRVEYTIGREESTLLVPRVIEVSRLQDKILTPLAEALASQGGEESLRYKKVAKYYLLMDPNEEGLTDVYIEMLYSILPITKKMAVYALDGETSSVQMAQVELLIKTYVPSYSYDDLEYDHELTEYEGEDENPPLFKLALEYTLGTDGLTVTCPANGLRFDESRYTLESLDILPYMGSGALLNEGYTFYPDGSGAIFNFEDLNTKSTQITGQIYGADYAYQTITATHQETIRYPVFGLVETLELSKKAVDGSYFMEETDRGFLAIIEEGDSMAKLTSYHGGTSSPYHSVKMTYYPRPKDSYNLKDAISSTSNGSSAMWTVVSSRKYTGNYSIRYIMLTDKDTAAKIQYDMGDEEFVYYECSYVGMADAYRDYLVKAGVLTPLTEADVDKDNIPLHINVLGAAETTQKIMSIPVDVMVPLTSFEDIQTIYSDLSDLGITNVNFKLTGFANGGMFSTIPYRLDWEDAVGGDDGFDKLLADANSKGYKVFPDFDFVYVSEIGMFDGLSLRKHVVKSIDNRYTSRREYSATKQAYVSYFELCLSPAYFDRFYTKLTENYLEFFTGTEYSSTISVGTLGSNLNSDFDEDDPYNREDSKSYTIEAFKYLDENYDYVMTSGGNAYTWQYVDYIIDVPLDSSRFHSASASIPFMGMVLHGFIQFSGTPINMEGNIDYAFLKAIENGASVNFILAYQNTTVLKENVRLSQYYSVRYDIWFDDVVSIYNELNTLLSEVQLETIVDHEFIEGMRVPDEDEIANDLYQSVIDSIQAESDALTAQDKAYIEAILNARQTIRTNNEALVIQISKLETYVSDIKRLVGTDADGNADNSAVNLNSVIDAFNASMQNFIDVYKGGTCSRSDLGKAASAVNSAARNLYALYSQSQNGAINYIADLAYQAEVTALEAYNSAIEAYDVLVAVYENGGLSQYILDLSWSWIEETAANAATIATLAPTVYDIAQSAYEYAVSGDAELTDAEGNVLCEISAYQFYLFAVCGSISVAPTTALDDNYVIQRYEIGLLQTDLTATAALEQMCKALNIESVSDTVDYEAVFNQYLVVKGASTRLGFETRYNNYMTRWEEYCEVYTKYKNKQATSAEVEAALKALSTTATQLNTEYNVLVAAFNGSQTKAAEVLPLYSEDVQADLLEKLNSFSLLYSEYLATEKPSKSQLNTLNSAASTLSDLFLNVSSLYAIVAKGSTAGINDYALYAENHKTVLYERYQTAERIYETLYDAWEENPDLWAENLAKAEEYLNETKAQYDAVATVADTVVQFANTAYEEAYKKEEVQKFTAAVEAVTIAAADNENLMTYVTEKLVARINPYDYIAEEEEEVPEEEEKPYNKYRSDDNEIVLVTYSNGTRFLLNYCNFAVIVEIDGVSYRVEAQSYQKIPAAESED